MSNKTRYDKIAADELFRRMALGEPIVVVDVRTATEYAKRHIPGSVLLPLQDLEDRVADIPNSGTPIAVVCQQGQRSASACARLVEHGLGPMLHLEGGLDRWTGPVTSGDPGPHRGRISPSSFLVNNFHHLKKGLALDVAMGEGRNAIYLATRGFDVDGVDADAERVARARVSARRLGAPIRAIVGNFEDGTYIIPIEAYDTICVFNFLHRPLFQDIRDGVVAGGVVIYQTYTDRQPAFGKPTNPNYLLRPDELKQVFADWEILNYRELVGPSRDRHPRAIAGIVARKPESS